MLLSGYQLRRLRQLADLSANDIASRMGISRSYVAMIEAGMRRVTYGLERRFLDALGVSPDEVKRGLMNDEQQA